MLITVSKKRISAIIDGAVSVAYSASGNPIVQVGPSGAKVVSYTPAFDPHGQRNGNMLNVPGNNGIPISTHNSLGSDPVLKAGDVLVIVRDAVNPNPRLIDWPQENSESRSRVDEMMAISFVPYKPVDGQLTPPIVGRSSNPIIQFLRNNPIPRELVEAGVSRLPRKFDLNLFNNDKPGFELLTKVFSDIWGDCYNGWSTDTNTPALQNPGYGRNISSWVSRAMIYALSTELPVDKLPLVTGMVDQGLSMAAAFADGRVNQADGGHMMSRKSLAIFAGWILNIPPMMNIDWLGDIFQENSMNRFEPGKHWWFNESWTAMWRKNGAYRLPLDRPPATWTDNEKWNFQGYYWPSCGASIGTALAMKELGLTEAWSSAFSQAVWQYMQPIPPEVVAELSAAGINFEWGLDWPAPWNGVGFQKQAWQLYGWTHAG